MKIILILKSILKMNIGKPQLEMELVEGSTVMDAVKQLQSEYREETEGFLFDRKTGDCYLLFVVNRKQVKSDHVLEGDDRLTILPPLAGG